MISELANRDGQIDALKADIIRRADENGMLTAQVAEKEGELNRIRAGQKELEEKLYAFETGISALQKWFIDSLSGSEDKRNTESGSGGLHVSLRFQVRAQDSPKVRKEPGTGGTVIGHAPASSEYEVLDISPGLWFMIRLNNGKTGWISSRMGSVNDFTFSFNNGDS